MQKERDDKDKPMSAQAKEEMMAYHGKVREKILRMPKANIDDLTINLLSGGTLGKVFTIDPSNPFKTIDILKETIIQLRKEAEEAEDLYLLKKTNEIIKFIHLDLEPIIADSAVFIAQMKRPPTQEEIAARELSDAQSKVELNELRKKAIDSNKFVREKIVPMEIMGGYTTLCFIENISKAGLPFLSGSMGENWIVGNFECQGQAVQLIIGMNLDTYDFSMLMPNSKTGEDVIEFFNKTFGQFPNIVYVDVDDPSKMNVLYLLGKKTEKKWLSLIAEDTTKKLIITNYYDGDVTEWGKPNEDDQENDDQENNSPVNE